MVVFILSMGHQLKILLFIWMMLSSSLALKATHIVGGDLTYKYLGADQYLVELYLYIDCINGSPSAIDQDKLAEIGVFNSSNTLVKRLTLTRTGPSRIEGKNFSCVIPPTNACVDLYRFQTTVSLPQIAGGYQLVFQRCCRNGTIKNINNPGGTGSTYRTFIPSSQYGLNSSAKFIGLPPNFLCTNEELVFDHSAEDADGDTLVYSLCNPLHGASTSDPLPIPVNSPPYASVNWRAGYSTVNQMDGSPMLSIDAQTGELRVTPNSPGQYVVGVCVQEIRNGVPINTVLRDFQFNVENCQFSVKSKFLPKYGRCSDTVSFDNLSIGGAVAYRWDFGLPGDGDTSIAKDPTFVFPGPGEYTVSMSAYNDQGCFNTSSYLVHILADGVPNLIPDSMVCYGSQVQLGGPNADARIDYQWHPSTGLNSATVADPIATVTSDIMYLVRRSNNTCYEEDSVHLAVDPIDADFYHKYLPPCDGLRVQFYDTSSFATRIKWDFGDPSTNADTSSQRYDDWFYQDSGIVYVTLRVYNQYCSDSVTKSLRIIFPEVFTAVIDTAICENDRITIGPLNDTSILSFEWKPTDGLADSSDLYQQISPSQSISYVLTKTYAECFTRDSFYIKVNEIPDFYITRSRTDSICLGDTIHLTANGNYQFVWTPTKGLSNPLSGSTEAFPDESTLYTVVATTLAGCTEQDSTLVEVYPMFELDLPAEMVTCAGDVFLPEKDIRLANYTWYELESEALLDSISEEGPYVVNAKTQCQSLWDTFQVAHYEHTYCAIDLPNAFTPNKDGVNEEYPFGSAYDQIFGIECDFDEYYLIIFNRWGEIVFRSENPRAAWDGRYKNDTGNIEVYGYYLQYREFNWCTGGWDIKVKRGNVTVIR